MLRICIALFVLSCFTGVCSTESVHCGKRSAVSNKLPWHVIIRSNGSESESPDCGGTILNELHVITAAHCLFELSGSAIEYTRMRVLIHGRNVTEEISIVKVFYPAQFIVDSFESDVAILKLKSSIRFNDDVGLVCFMESSRFIKIKVITIPIAREGSNDSDIVQWKVSGQTLCHETNRDIFELSYNYTICMGNFLRTDKFQLNRGSEMVVEQNGSWHLVGVLLYTTGPAENISTYGGGVDVSPFFQWINRIVTRHLKLALGAAKCQHYKTIVNSPRNVYFTPTITLKLFTEEVCYGTLISERFILTAAVCTTKAIDRVLMVSSIVDYMFYYDFKFHFHPEDEHRQGIALVELKEDARDMQYFIHCLWTDEDEPFHFTTELAHGTETRGSAKIAVTYVPQKTFYIRFVDKCYPSSAFAFYKPGDALVEGKPWEEVKQVVGLINYRVNDCRATYAVNVINHVPWIVEVVWGG